MSRGAFLSSLPTLVTGNSATTSELIGACKQLPEPAGAFVRDMVLEAHR